MHEQLRVSIEQVIRDHISQDVDYDNAVIEASREIVDGLLRPISGPSLNSALALIDRIDQTLRVPAAEYVPAIGDVFRMIDDFKAQQPVNR